MIQDTEDGGEIWKLGFIAIVLPPFTTERFLKLVKAGAILASIDIALLILLCFGLGPAIYAAVALACLYVNFF